MPQITARKGNPANAIVARYQELMAIGPQEDPWLRSETVALRESRRALLSLWEGLVSE